MKVIESFTTSKSFDEELNEDGFFCNENYIAVIDGATSKAERRIGKVSSGRFAMQTIKKALAKANWEFTPFELIEFLNKSLKEEIKAEDNFANFDTPIASVIVYNNTRKEIVSYGDCACTINGVLHKHLKKADEYLSKKRANIIKDMLNNCATINDIRKKDVGREAILEELKQQAEVFANNPNGGYPCINGGKTIEAFIKVFSVCNCSVIELASDGYPELCGTLKDSEDRLQVLIKKDVLCIDELCSTKGVAVGNKSFDDRTYIRFII